MMCNCAVCGQEIFVCARVTQRELEIVGVEREAEKKTKERMRKEDNRTKETGQEKRNKGER